MFKQNIIIQFVSESNYDSNIPNCFITIQSKLPNDVQSMRINNKRMTNHFIYFVFCLYFANIKNKVDMCNVRFCFDQLLPSDYVNVK